MGFTPDIAEPRPSDLTGVKLSRDAIHFGAGACSPGPGRLRHCLTARSRSSTPSVSLMAYAAVDGPLLLATPAASAMISTSPPTTASPRTQPATNAGPLLRALGVISIKMTAMMDSTLMSTAIASGRIPPIASPMVTPASFATAGLGISPGADRTPGPSARVR